MTFKQFEEKLIDYLADYYGDDYRISTADVTKNNGVILRGLTVRGVNECICPTVYINTYYEDILSGSTFQNIIHEITSVIDASEKDISFDLSFLENEEELKKNILVKLISKEQNKALLEELAYVDFLDLAAVFYVMVSDKNAGNGTIMLKKQNIEEYGIDYNELFEIAKENNKRLLGTYIEGIETILLRMLREKSGEIPEELGNMIRENADNGSPLPMYVMSNKYNLLGAACMLDTDKLKEFSDEIDSDFYIIPSSIHETILVPESEGQEYESLKEMIKEVNCTEVPVSEVLSDKLYKYRRACKGISFC